MVRSETFHRDILMGSFHCNGVLHAFVVRWRTLRVPALAVEPVGEYHSVSHGVCPLSLWLFVPSERTVDSAPMCAPCVTGCLCPLKGQLTVPHCVPPV